MATPSPDAQGIKPVQSIGFAITAESPPEPSTHTYEISVYHKGRWWTIYVPEIDELTQARHVSETEDMARSLIAVSTETPIADVGVRVVKRD